MKKTTTALLVLLTVSILGLQLALRRNAIAAESAQSCVPLEQKLGKSGTMYVVYYQSDHALNFATSRPDPKDKNIVFCVAAAFTTTDNRIDGVYICNGKVGNENQVNNRIGGALEAVSGRGTIFGTASGRKLTKEYIQDLANKRGSLFQQFQVVAGGNPEKFTDKGHVERRGLAEFADGRMAVVESLAPITINTFGQDLAGMGAKNLLYLDMGPWSEGWVRLKNGKTVAIGPDRSLTFRQTNWLIFCSSPLKK